MAEVRVIVVVPPVEITERTLPEFERELLDHLAENVHGIVVDLASVTFINSAGLGTLVKVGMRLDRVGGRLAFARPIRATQQTITLLGLDRKMPIFSTVDAAREHVMSSVAHQD